jgi:uncharacterized membrane-anchored protein
MTTEERRAETDAAARAAGAAALAGPASIPLAGLGSLSIPASYAFIPKAESVRLIRAWGNAVDADSLLGLISGPRASALGVAVLSFTKHGYVEDKEAESWDVDELLANMKHGVDADNEARRERGFPEREVVGWVEKPTYDATTHHLFWSMALRRKNAPAGETASANYTAQLLAREGYFTLDLMTGADHVEALKPIARDLLARLSLAQGKHYEDFTSHSGDKVAPYGITALIGRMAPK